MQQDEVDKIIAEAVASSKKESKWHRPSGKSLKIQRARQVLNALFMIGFIAAIIIYILQWNSHDKTLFFCVGFGSMILKIIEFILRFMF